MHDHGHAGAWVNFDNFLISEIGRDRCLNLCFLLEKSIAAVGFSLEWFKIEIRTRP